MATSELFLKYRKVPCNLNPLAIDEYEHVEPAVLSIINSMS